MNHVASAVILPIITALAVLSSASRAIAQSAEASDEIGLYLGEQLPSGIDNVAEILPLFGFRYGIGTSKLGIIDLGLFNSHAHGIDFSTAEVSLRGDVPLGPGLEGLYYGGADFNYYKPVNQEERKSVFGYHVGAGAMMSVTDNLWIRGDLKLLGSPGTSLLLLFGFVFRSPSGSSN